MPDLKNEIDLYLQRLLALQYGASELISHRLTKGELREKFVKDLVLSQFPNLLVRNGIIIDEAWQSSQGDFILLKSNARTGSLSVYELNDCKLFMEIKSKATSSEMEKLNRLSLELHERMGVININARILVGMFCYSTKPQRKTVLQKFGFEYDKDLQGFSCYNPEKDMMKNIDFLFSLDITENDSIPYIIVRDIYGACTLYIDNPVIKYFLNFFKEN